MKEGNDRETKKLMKMTKTAEIEQDRRYFSYVKCVFRKFAFMLLHPNRLEKSFVPRCCFD